MAFGRRGEGSTSTIVVCWALTGNGCGWYVAKPAFLGRKVYCSYAPPPCTGLHCLATMEAFYQPCAYCCCVRRRCLRTESRKERGRTRKYTKRQSDLPPARSIARWRIFRASAANTSFSLPLTIPVPQLLTAWISAKKKHEHRNPPSFLVRHRPVLRQRGFDVFFLHRSASQKRKYHSFVACAARESTKERLRGTTLPGQSVYILHQLVRATAVRGVITKACAGDLDEHKRRTHRLYVRTYEAREQQAPLPFGVYV